ncbi:peptidase M50 [Mycobacterium sp.]|uniref:peptidase M50 n=1 Tax=Mycobacterium sp. TaxID=1785 RepID=UPI002D460A5F|nr:peptidase M50 [Mycobacterium sp.]HZA09538.1 peptidase M50 [Mycobacterium sp.]
MAAADVAVLLFGDHRLPGRLAGLPVADAADIDAACRDHRRLIVVGSDADLAAVLTELLRTERLDVEIGFVSPHRSAATRAYRLPRGRRAARRSLTGTARRVPLIRDDTGHAIAGAAMWRGVDGPLHGEAVVDDTTLFDGDVAWVRVEPTARMPGLRAAVVTFGGRSGRWVTGRAAQLGTTGALVSRDGVAAERAVKRSTFYRHITGWLLVK